MSSGEILLYIGIALMAAAAIGGVAAIVALTVLSKRLDVQLKSEFGEKPR